MKRKFIFLVLPLMLSLGCNDYTVKTSIHPDGSFERTIICDGDSLGVYKIHLPYIFSDSWTIDVQRKAGSGSSFITTARKTYTDGEQLMTELAQGKDSSKLQISSRIEKRFRWFFTYYRYEETLPSYAIFRHLSPDSFFTPAEIGYIRENRDTLVSKRLEEFWTRNIGEEFFQRLLVIVDSLHDPSLSRSLFVGRKEALLGSILDSKADKPNEIERIFEKTLGTKSVRKIYNRIDTMFKAMTKELEREADLDISYRNEVAMPGMLITSNASDIVGNNVSWKCRSNKYFDITMTAESRRVNLWTVITTSLVCLAMLAGLLLPLLRRKTG